jgi:hypothetical protein
VVFRDDSRPRPRPEASGHQQRLRKQEEKCSCPIGQRGVSTGEDASQLTLVHFEEEQPDKLPPRLPLLRKLTHQAPHHQDGALHRFRIPLQRSVGLEGHH